MTRVYNFSAGPAALPAEVLQQASDEMLDWHGCGMGVMEMSHRGKEFMSIHAQALADLRDLLNVPANYKILFLQGGGIGENAIVPMNLMGLAKGSPEADFIVTGSWSKKTYTEAQKYGKANLVASASSQNGQVALPDAASYKLSDSAAYVHACTNETIDGIEFQHPPKVGNKVLVADMSSHILSRTINVADYGVIYAGAQKNIGPAGVVIVIVREDLLGHALPITPSAFDWRIVAEHDSMFNTPPTYGIYIAGLVFQWLKRQGGVAAIEANNIAKAKLLYDAIDSSNFYENRVHPSCRSRMNVTFFLKDESRNDAFLAAAKVAGLVQLKGHKSVGGMRASIYNAMPLEGVQALVNFMQDFARSV